MFTNNIKNDMKRSSFYFKNLIIPKIIPILEEDYKHIKYIIPIENSDDEFKKQIDIYSGIDYNILYENNMRGISSRVLKEQGYRTFTIRYSRHTGSKTEYEKTTTSIKDECQHSYYTIISYIDYKLLSSITGIAKTTDLMNYIEMYKPLDYDKMRPVYLQTNQIDNNEFIVVGWEEYKKENWFKTICGYDMFRIEELNKIYREEERILYDNECKEKNVIDFGYDKYGREWRKYQL